MLDPAASDVLVVLGVVFGLAGIAVGAFALFRLSQIHRSLALLEASEGRETIVDVMGRAVGDVQDLRQDLRALDTELGQTREQLALALRHVSVVRYDAFGDMGGRFSFSAALVDDGGDGLVITSIHGRTETRTYLKGIASGKPDIELSPEERQALELARGVGA